MKKNLLIANLDIPTPEKEEKVLSPSEEASKSKTNSVSEKGYCFTIDDDNKKIDVILYGVISNVQKYKKLISLFHSSKEGYNLFFHLHTPGGNINTACAILTAMSRCKSTIITHNMGMAASCGSLLLSFGDKIAVERLSITMFHNAISGYSDSLHRMKTKVDHTVNRVTDLFHRMISRGILTEGEAFKIIDNGEEFFLTSDVIIERLRTNGLLFEGEM